MRAPRTFPRDGHHAKRHGVGERTGGDCREASPALRRLLQHDLAGDRHGLQNEHDQAEPQAQECRPWPRTTTRGRAFVDKLSKLADLASEDISELIRATARVRSFGAHSEIVPFADRNAVFIVLEGFAARYRQLRSGRRQIFACYVPGDHFDARSLALDGVASLSSCRAAFVSRAVYQNMILLHPQIAAAIASTRSIEEATSREWLLNLGARSAVEKIAHLFCELFVRLQAVDLVQEDSYYFPVNQADLGSTLGLSPVHLNRMLQNLREDNLIELRERRLRIKDLSKLSALAQFTPDYLRPMQMADEPHT